MMYLCLKASKVWQIGSSPFLLTLRNEGASYTSIRMAIYHHKPSTTLARVRQLLGYRSHLDSQTQQRKANENKSKKRKKKSWFDSNNNERKDLLIPVLPSIQACSHSSMKVSSPLSYINKTKITWKKIKNLSYKLQISLSSSLCLVLPCTLWKSQYL